MIRLMLLSLFSVLSVVCNPLCANSPLTGQIIYINGPSSSGKTTLAKALQEHFQEPFLRIGIDFVIEEMLPEKFQKRSDESTEKDSLQNISPFGKKLIQTLKEVVLTLARMGHYVIVDDVAFGKEAVDLWKEALKDYKVVWIGLNPPLDVLEAREKARGDRKIGLARSQYSLVHEGVNYDLKIDPTKTPTNESVMEIDRLMRFSSH